jgi:AcrR family transcriptional regulator
MSRQPHARTAVLAAAESLVRDIGAANLTFDELVRRSGITRGGITYHFPTKEALLSALVERGVADWQACMADKRLQHAGPNEALLAYIDSGCEPDEEAARLCAGMLTAATSARQLNEPWRDFFEAQKKLAAACGDPELAMILRLAVEGLFWSETTDVLTLAPRRRKAIVDRMMAMAAAIEPKAAKAGKAAPARKPAIRKKGGA